MCAKRFYNVGDDVEPSVGENLKHLKEELLRNQAFKQALDAFIEHTRDRNVSIHGMYSSLQSVEDQSFNHGSPLILDLEIAESNILVVCDGPAKGLAWIIDKMLDDKKFWKFSGSDEAGSARADDFEGLTADAFAHFVAVHSDLEFVLVDIQGEFSSQFCLIRNLKISLPGIKTPVFKNSVRCPDATVLFDLMAHRYVMAATSLRSSSL